jgi:putative lipoic acid-binding regulatory protein
VNALRAGWIGPFVVDRVACRPARPTIKRRVAIAARPSRSIAMSERKEQIIEFPTRFPIKIMGARHDDFSQTIFELVRIHAADLTAEDIELRVSSGGNYISLTVTVLAISQEQLDNIYRAVTGHPMVKYVL